MIFLIVGLRTGRFVAQTCSFFFFLRGTVSDSFV